MAFLNNDCYSENYCLILVLKDDPFRNSNEIYYCIYHTAQITACLILTVIHKINLYFNIIKQNGLFKRTGESAQTSNFDIDFFVIVSSNKKQT